MSKLFFAFFGWIFVVVGVIGIFIPLLPTTPFLLLAGFCFNKSSERFHDWLLNHKILGPPVRNWAEHRIISKRAKWTATALISTSGVYLFYKDTIPLYGRQSAMLVLALVVVFLWSQRSK